MWSGKDSSVNSYSHDENDSFVDWENNSARDSVLASLGSAFDSELGNHDELFQLE